MNASDKKDQISIDFGAVDEPVNVTGIHGLSWHQGPCANAVASWRNKIHSQDTEKLFFSVNKSLHFH